LVYIHEFLGIDFLYFHWDVSDKSDKGSDKSDKVAEISDKGFDRSKEWAVTDLSDSSEVCQIFDS